MWLKHPGFVDTIKDWSNSREIFGLPRQIFRLKLKFIHNKLRRWNKNVFGNIEERKIKALESIKKWNEKVMHEGFSNEERSLMMATKDEFSRVVEMEEIMWKQKAKVHWLKEGNENATFFHKMTSCRRGVNLIHRLKVGNSYTHKSQCHGNSISDDELFYKPFL